MGSLKRKKNITKLKLNHSAYEQQPSGSITDIGAGYLANVFEYSKLETLEIKNNNITDLGLRRMGRKLVSSAMDGKPPKSTISIVASSDSNSRTTELERDINSANDLRNNYYTSDKRYKIKFTNRILYKVGDTYDGITLAWPMPPLIQQRLTVEVLLCTIIL